MGTQYSWADELEKAAKAFGGSYPDAALEQELLEVFRERPAFVVDAIKDVTGGFEAGRIKSPWPFLRKRVGEAAPDVVVSDASDRDRAVVAAERWMRTAGLHFDRWEEAELYLFGGVRETAPLAYLEQLERETRGRAGRQAYGRVLLAAIARTRRDGVQEIEALDGPLAAWAGDEFRGRLHSLYEEVRPLGERIEQEDRERAETHKAALARIKAELERRRAALDADADWVGEEPPVTAASG